jgi:hypothetical protein
MKKLPEAAPQHVPEPAGESRSKPKPSSPSKRRPLPEAAPQHMSEPAGPFKKAKGGMIKKYVNGGVVTRADGCITKGPTKGRMV